MDAHRLEQHLSAFVERRERGEALSPEAFAAEQPEAGPELLAALRALVSAEALFPEAAPDLPGRIGAYRILGEIGRGGMGRVFQAVHPQHPETPVALKLLHVSLEHQPRALERFRREGKALERLDHPGIVRVLEAGLCGDRPYLAMEHVEGTGLGKLLVRARERGGPLVTGADLELPGAGTPLERAVRLVARLARALEAAHGAGILHRDLNPRNVLVRADGQPVVIDFGLVRASGEPTLTASGDLLGTPQYMAPEQARGEGVDERSDVFGLGAILWGLLTLSPPRPAADTLALVRAAGARPLGDPARRVLGIDRPLATVLWRATAHVPRWRYASAAELAGDLERWLAGQPIHARAPGPWARVVELVLTRRRAAAVASVLVLVALVAVVARTGGMREDRHARLAEATTAVVLPWLDGDLARARAALAAYRSDADPPTYAPFLAFLVDQAAAPSVHEPAVRALVAGETARRSGDPATALAHFRSAWDLAPDVPFVLVLQGLAALEAGELAAAREALERSARAFGTSPRLHRALGELYSRLGLWSDAARAWHAAATLVPEDAAVWHALADARARAGMNAPALEAARRAVALDALRRDELADAWAGAGRTDLADELRRAP